MHDSAYRIGELVMRTYGSLPNANILEIGSLNVNGCLRDAAASDTHYVGLDLEEGPSVDFVITPGTPFPVDDDSFDLVMASSVFEHDSRFWDTFVRMCRAARPGGHVYVNAPSNGTVHRYPRDCWRFYPDAGLALAEHARSEGMEIDLVESFIGNRHSDIWNDFVAVFRKGPCAEPLNTAFVYHRYPSLNARTWQSNAVYNESDSTEDMTLIRQLREQCGNPRELEQVRADLAAAQEERTALSEDIARLSASLAEAEQHDNHTSADNMYLVGQRAALESDLRDRQEEVEQGRAALAEAQDQRAALVEDVARLSDALAEAEQRSDRACADNADFIDRMDALENDVRDRQEEVERGRAALTEAQEQRAALVEDMARLSAALAETERRSDQTSASNAHLMGQIATLESNLLQRQEEIGQAWTRTDELAAEGQGLRARITELQTLRERLEARLADADGWVFDLAGERRALEIRLAAVQSELQQSKRSIARLASHTSDAQHQIERHSTVNAHILAGVARLAELDPSAPRSLNAEIETLPGEWRAEKHPLAGVIGLLHAMTRSILHLIEQKSALHTDIASLVQRLEEQGATDTDAKAQISKLTETVTSLRSDALDYHGKAAQALDRLEILKSERNEQARSIREIEERAAKKDRDLAWLRRLYQMLEYDDSWWNSVLPSQMRKQRLAKALRQDGLFDADAYLTRYPDVVEAGMDPLRHYILHGMAEGRPLDEQK